MSTTTKPLDVAEVRALLVRAVEEKGADYIYERQPDPDGYADEPICVYFKADGSPSCIAGHAFAYAGLNPRGVVEGNTASAALKSSAGLTLTIAARDALDAAQAVQDDGKTWGEALAAFDEAVQS